MNSRKLHWLLFLLGLLAIIAAVYCYLTNIKGYCVCDIYPEYFSSETCFSSFTPEQQAEGHTSFLKDLFFILSSLLLPAVLFYTAGKYLGKGFLGNNLNTSNTTGLSNIEAELNECKRKYDALLVESSGAKITKKTSVKSTPKKSLTSIEKQMEAKIAKNKTKTSSVAFDKTKAKEVFGKNLKLDDLKVIEGIGPKIASILNGKGINTWNDLANTQSSIIEKYLLEVGGPTYKIHDPSTWPKQANLAANGKFKELKKLQDKLKGGRKV